MTFPEDYKRIHPCYKEFVLKELEREQATASVSIEEKRQQMKQQHRAERGQVPEVRCSSHTIPVDEGDSKTVQLYVIRPPGTETTTLPVMVFLHGGGWIFGDKEIYEKPVAELALRACAAVVFVEYARSPEAAYPVALQQAWAAIRWVHMQGAAIHVDPHTLVVAGDSVGGNLAAAVCLLAKQRGSSALIKGQILIYPVLDFGRANTSSVALYSGPEFGLSIDAVHLAQQSYYGQLTTSDMLVSPALASAADLAGLPPTLVATAECDVLRDEGEAYAARLMQAGVRVAAIRILGTIHGFLQMNTAAAHDPLPPYSQLLGSIASFMHNELDQHSV